MITLDNTDKQECQNECGNDIPDLLYQCMLCGRWVCPFCIDHRFGCELCISCVSADKDELIWQFKQIIDRLYGQITMLKMEAGQYDGVS